MDISLSRTGLAVVDGGGRLVYTRTASPRSPQRSSVLWGGASLSEALGDVCSRYKISSTMVEDFLQTFEANASSSHTRFTLARMNGIGAFEAWRHTGSPVLWAYPTTMRSYFHLGREAQQKQPAAVVPLPQQQQQRHRSTSRAKAKSAVASFLSSAQPSLRGGGRQLEEDEADAALAAMYCLAQEVEWRVLAGSASEEGSSAFWGLVDAKLPTARLGKLGEAGHGVPRAALRGALQELHRAAMSSEAAKREAPSGGLGGAPAPGGGGLQAVLQTGGAKAAPKRKARSKATAAASSSSSSSGAAAAPLDPKALDRLYKRIRLAFSHEVRSTLVEGPGSLWPAS